MFVDEGKDKDIITPPEEPEGEEKGEGKEKEGEAPEEKLVPQTELDAANKKIAAMEERINTLTDTLVSPDFLKGQVPAKEKEGEAKEPTEQELEDMSRKDYAALIVNKTIGAVGTLVSQLVQRQEFFETKKAQDDTIKKYSDYWDYKNEMIVLSKRYPGVSPEDVYLIACGKKNPPKKPDVPKASSTEKPGVATQFATKKMGAEEAAKLAWDETMGNK